MFRQINQFNSSLIFWLVLALLMSACAGVSIPQTTPTVAPSRTPTPEQTAVALEPSRTPLLTATYTAQATQTDLPPSATATPTFTPTPTETPVITLTYTPSTVPSLTQLPRTDPTNTPTPSPSPTETHTAQPTATQTPVPPSNTPVPPPTQDSSEIQEQPTVQPSWTPVWTATPTHTVAPATLDVTPVYITSTAEIPPELAQTLPAVEGDDTVETFDITETPTPAPTVANVLPPATVAIQSLPFVQPQQLDTRAFIIDPSGIIQPHSTGNVGNPTLLVQNPRFPDQFIITDHTGQLYNSIGGTQHRASGKMFDACCPGTPQENNGFVSHAAWSPDGLKIAFIVDAFSVKGREATADDGIWFMTPGQAVTDANQLLIHCAQEGMDQCNTVVRDSVPYIYRAKTVIWSPDSQQILASIEYMDGSGNFRGGLMVLTPGRDRTHRPPALQYDYGDWSGDGQRIVVSGRDANGRVVLGSVLRDGSGENIVLDGSARGLWLQNGVQRPNGSLVALGRMGDANGAMSLFDQNGNALTAPIGNSAPAAVRWNPQRDAVYVHTIDGRSYLAYVNGNITEISQQVGEVSAVGWVSGQLPPTSGTGVDGGILPADYVPSGVIEGSRLSAGQQLRVNSTTTDGLNLRQIPSTSGEALNFILNGSYVAILAGPVNAGGIEWWQVQTASNEIGWMAGRIDGIDVLMP